MNKIYIFASGKCDNENGNSAKLTKEEITATKNAGLTLSNNIPQFSTRLWVAPNIPARLTAFVVRNSLLLDAGKRLEYYEDYYLDDETLVADFIEKKLKKSATNNNIIIADKVICDKLIKLMIGEDIIISGQMCYIKYDLTNDEFINQGILS